MEKSFKKLLGMILLLAMVAGMVPLQASADPDKVTVRFHPNNGTDETMDEQVFMPEEAAKALSTCTFTVPEKKALEEWNTEASGNGQSVALKDQYSVTMKYTYEDLKGLADENGILDLYAQWKYPGKIELSYRIIHPDEYRNYQSPPITAVLGFARPDTEEERVH